MRMDEVMSYRSRGTQYPGSQENEQTGMSMEHLYSYCSLAYFKNRKRFDLRSLGIKIHMQ